jgi:hypothetical protein
MPRTICLTGDSHLLGDGSDGPADLDGITAYPWALRDGSTYRLIRDAHLTTLKIRDGISVAGDGWQILVRRELEDPRIRGHGTMELGCGVCGAATPLAVDWDKVFATPGRVSWTCAGCGTAHWFTVEPGS